MVGEFIAGLGAFKTMFDLAKGLKNASDANTRNAVAIELQEKILSTQAEQMALVERVSELEKEMARFETWETEKQRYRLIQFMPGVVAYVLKKSEANNEPGHALCTNCYEHGVKSILQSNRNPYVDKHAFDCPSCKVSIKTGGQPPPEYAD